MNTWASSLARALNLLILTPFILSYFESSEISFWFFLVTVSSFTFVFELGFGPTITRAIAYGFGGANSLKDPKGEGKPNVEFLSNIWRNIGIVYIGLTFLLLIVLLVMGFFAVEKPISYLPDAAIGWRCWWITIVGIAVLFFGNLFSVYLQGVGKLVLVRRYEALFSLASTLSLVTTIYLGADLLSIVMLTQFWNVVTVFRNWNLCRKDPLFREITHLNSWKIDKNLFGELWQSSWRSAVGIIMSYGIINSVLFYYAQSEDVEEVGSLLFSYRILQMIITFSMAPFYSKLPELARLYSVGNRVELLQIGVKSVRNAHIVFVLLTTLLPFFAPTLLGLIGSKLPFMDADLWFIFVFAYFFERYGAMHIQLHSVSNNIKWHIANTVTGIVFFILILITHGTLGLYSFPISILLAYLSFYSWYSPILSQGVFKYNWISFEWRSSFRPFLYLVFFTIVYFIFFDQR